MVQNRVSRAAGVPVRALSRARPTGLRRRRSSESGDGAQNSAVVDCGLYAGGKRQAGHTDYADALDAARGRNGAFAWLGLHEPTFDELSDIAATFGLHPLAVEDVVHAHQRPKLERYGDTTFIVMKTVRYCEHNELTGTTEVIEIGEVMLFVGPDFLVTVRHGESELISLRAHLDQGSKLLAHGPWAVAYAVIDQIVDDYLSVIDEVATDIDEVEASVLSPLVRSDLNRLYQLKRQLLGMRRAVLPLARPMAELTAKDSSFVPAEISRYFRDVEDHLQRVTDQVQSFDDLLTTILEAQLAQVGVQQNNDMRKISAWVAMAAVPTMLAGIYGMNFRYMPELQWHYAYFVVLGVMASSAVALYIAFRRSGWL